MANDGMNYDISKINVTSTNTASVTNVVWDIAPPQLGPVYFDDAIHEVAREIAEVIIAKQKDYGPKNIAETPFGPDKGILVRVWDKMCRLRNLLSDNVKEPQNESIYDTWLDLAGYSMIALMFKKGWFLLPLKPESLTDEKSDK